jgi:fucose 4-O-acetylase-like acetyltransferase
MDKERVKYIDVAKAYLIMLVVVGHILIVLNPDYSKKIYVCIQEIIYAFHMPAFFIIHGVLFDEIKWRDKSFLDWLKKRIYGLIIPYVFFETIAIIWKAAFMNQSIQKGIYNMITFQCNVGADWFLIAMFFGSLGLFIYIKYFRNFENILINVIVVVIVGALIISDVISNSIHYHIVIGRAFVAFIFVMIGFLGKEFFKNDKYKSFLITSIAMLVTVIVAALNIKIAGNDIFSFSIKNPVTLIVGGISGTIFILGVAYNSNSRLLEELGLHTLTIMGTHQLVMYLLLYKFPNLYNGNIIAGFIIAICIIIFEIPVVFLFDRYIPFLRVKNK